MPTNAVRVARPGRWGNPYRIGERTPGDSAVGAGAYVTSREIAVQLFREFAAQSPGYRRGARTALAGRSLACWCPIEDAEGIRVPCHADVLLEIANS